MVYGICVCLMQSISQSVVVVVVDYIIHSFIRSLRSICACSTLDKASIWNGFFFVYKMYRGSSCIGLSRLVSAFPIIQVEWPSGLRRWFKENSLQTVKNGLETVKNGLHTRYARVRVPFIPSQLC